MKETTSYGKLLKISMLGIVGSILVIVLVVLATPLDEPTVPSELQSEASSIYPIQAADLNLEALQGELKRVAEQLLQDFPADAAAQHTAAQVYAELNETNRAKEIWRAAVNGQPEGPGPYVGLANLLVDEGHDEEALGILEKCMRDGFSSKALSVTLGGVYERTGSPGKALEQLFAALRLDPGDARLHLDVGKILSNSNRLDEARSHLTRALESNTTAREACIMLISVEQRLKHSAEAERLRNLLEDLPESERSRDYRENYLKSLSRVAHNIYLNLGTIQVRHSQTASAIVSLNRSLECFPESIESYTALSQCFLEIGELTALQQVNRELVRLAPGNVVHFSNLANVALQNGNSALAIQTLKHAIETHPNVPVLRSALVTLLIEEGKLVEAKTIAQDWVEMDDSQLALQTLANVIRAAGEENAAATVEKRLPSQ